MKELFRLFGYAKRYAPVLALAVVLMMIAARCTAPFRCCCARSSTSF